MPTATVRDIEIYYELGGNSGSGRRLLMVNGTGGDLRQKPSPMDGPLGHDFELLGFDQRGLGRSGKPDRAYTMADYASDALGLLDHVGWDRCSLYGISFGGMVAQEMAVTAPERFERVVLACTSPGGAGGASYPLHELLGGAKDGAADPEEAHRTHMRLLDTRGEGAGELMKQIAKAMQARQTVGAGEAGREDGLRRQLAARKDHDTYDRLPRLTMPVLIAAGRYDGIAAPANQEAMHERIPKSRLEWFEGGHVFMMQDPRAQTVIRDFLLE